MNVLREEHERNPSQVGATEQFLKTNYGQIR